MQPNYITPLAAPAFDNTKLLQLLAEYHKQKGGGQSYAHVLNELLNGNACLLLTSLHDGSQQQGWSSSSQETTLQLTCVQQIENVKALAAFTDESSLLSWTKVATHYTMLAAKDVLKLCEMNGIDRIIINSDLPNMYILQKNNVPA